MDVARRATIPQPPLRVLGHLDSIFSGVLKNVIPFAGTWCHTRELLLVRIRPKGGGGGGVGTGPRGGGGGGGGLYRPQNGCTEQWVFWAPEGPKILFYAYGRGKFYCLRQVHLAENLPQATHTRNGVKTT